MTSNQLSYQANEEVERHNIAMEGLQDKANREAARHNQALENLEHTKQILTEKLANDTLNWQKYQGEQQMMYYYAKLNTESQLRRTDQRIQQQLANAKETELVNQAAMANETKRHNTAMEGFQEVQNRMKVAELTLYQAKSIAEMYDIQEQRRLQALDVQIRSLNSLNEAQRTRFEQQKYLSTGQYVEGMKALKDAASAVQSIVSGFTSIVPNVK